MTSVGINAASKEALAASFVSVSMSQVTVTKGRDFSSVLSGSLEKGTAQNTNRTYTDLKVTRAEVKTEATPVSVNDKAGIDEKGAVRNTEPDKDVVADDVSEMSDVETGSLIGQEKTQAIQSEEKDFDDCIKALEILNTLMQGIADLLSTTTDKLADCYEELNIQPSQMFTVTTIQLTVVTFENLSDPSDLLVDNDAFMMFDRIREFVQDVLDEAGMELTDFGQIIESDLFEEFAGPIETGDVEELLQKFTFDEDGRLIAPAGLKEDHEKQDTPVSRQADDEPFAVEVNVERTMQKENNAPTGGFSQNSGDDPAKARESAKPALKSSTEQRTTYNLCNCWRIRIFWRIC